MAAMIAAILRYYVMIITSRLDMLCIPLVQLFDTTDARPFLSMRRGEAARLGCGDSYEIVEVFVVQSSDLFLSGHGCSVLHLGHVEVR